MRPYFFAPFVSHIYWATTKSIKSFNHHNYDIQNNILQS